MHEKYVSVLKRLVAMPEWKVYEDFLQEELEVLKEAMIMESAKPEQVLSMKERAIELKFILFYPRQIVLEYEQSKKENKT